MYKNNLTILQWNIRSVNKNRTDLVNLSHKHNPDLLFINETWFKQEHNFYLKTFNIIRQLMQIYMGADVNNTHINGFKLVPYKARNFHLADWTRYFDLLMIEDFSEEVVDFF